MMTCIGTNTERTQQGDYRPQQQHPNQRIGVIVAVVMALMTTAGVLLDAGGKRLAIDLQSKQLSQQQDIITLHSDRLTRLETAVHSELRYINTALEDIKKAVEDLKRMREPVPR